MLNKFDDLLVVLLTDKGKNHILVMDNWTRFLRKNHIPDREMQKMLYSYMVDTCCFHLYIENFVGTAEN